MCSSSVGGPSSILSWIQFRTKLHCKGTLGMYCGQFSYIQLTTNATKPFLNSPQQRPDWSNSRRNERMGVARHLCGTVCPLSRFFLVWLTTNHEHTIPGSLAIHSPGERGKGRAEQRGLGFHQFLSFCLSSSSSSAAGRPGPLLGYTSSSVTPSTGNFVIALSYCDDPISVTNPN
ncbi:hypothetical protein GE21DRAFT_1245972 [Neurospora crassa]|nr:hypothetical protein B2O8.60 [imported] - Neurospora crassa [Neurospora crassa]KHE78460.1 hypothetical protein GE21DRAFT_1245972 [Neurospora crassa]